MSLLKTNSFCLNLFFISLPVCEKNEKISQIIQCPFFQTLFHIDFCNQNFFPTFQPSLSTSREKKGGLRHSAQDNSRRRARPFRSRVSQWKPKTKGKEHVSRQQQSNHRRTTQRRSHRTALTLSLRPRPALLSTDYIFEIAGILQPPIRTIGLYFPDMHKKK